MRRLLFALIVSSFLFTSCSKPKVSTYMDFTPNDITSVTTHINTLEESDVLDVRGEYGAEDFMELLSNITIDHKLDPDTIEESWYYSYSFNLSNGDKVQFVDYQDKLKVIDKKNNVYWYEISSNSWEELTDLWMKYYVDTDTSNDEVIKRKNNENILNVPMKKPVIYLYPEEPTELVVLLEVEGEISYTYPEYHSGWNVLAYPDGMIKNVTDGKNYSYLFWEGFTDTKFDMKEGFVVKGSDTTKFLEEKLSYLGLSSKEYNDFIVYWAPEMSENPYNMIRFIQEEYTEIAKLKITPEPDSMLRIFMAYQPLEQYIDVPEQILKPWVREGFSVVEWGGTVINDTK